LNEELDPKGVIVSVEDVMSSISGMSLRKLVMENISEQYTWWQKAWDNVLSSLDSSKRTFITFHGVYYHQMRREFLSPIDVGRLSKLRGKVKAIIVLIDDIYDVYRRLMDDGEMFNEVVTDPTLDSTGGQNLDDTEQTRIVRERKALQSLYESPHNLITILEWRQLEIAIARVIGKLLDIPMYIVATKHPTCMVAKLIEKPLENLKIYYLSHPISSIRENASERLVGFIGELNVFLRDILDSNSEIVLFMPSTIDEFRIRNENGIYYPECLPRWELPYDEKEKKCLFPILSTRLSNIKPLNPLDLDISHLNIDHPEFNMSNSEVEKSVSCLLKLLLERIRLRVTSRDLSLVDQCRSGVIAYTPYFPDELSGGVRRELEHNYSLHQEGDSRRSIILSVREEQGKDRIRLFFNTMESLLTNRVDLHPQRDEWIHNGEMVKIFSKDKNLKKKSEFIRKEIEEILPKNYSFKGSFLYSTTLQIDAMGRQERGREIGFQQLFALVLTDALGPLVISPEDYRVFDSRDELRRKSIPDLRL
jgi:hypothetical protein